MEAMAVTACRRFIRVLVVQTLLEDFPGSFVRLRG
jgi:hypothetical protein